MNRLSLSFLLATVIYSGLIGLWLLFTSIKPNTTNQNSALQVVPININIIEISEPTAKFAPEQTPEQISEPTSNLKPALIPEFKSKPKTEPKPLHVKNITKPNTPAPKPLQNIAQKQTTDKSINTIQSKKISVEQTHQAEQQYLQQLQQTIAQHAVNTYPQAAQRRRWQGTALVSFTLFKDGKITNVKVVKSSGRNMLDQAALNILEIEMHRKFKPFPEEVTRTSWGLKIPVKYEFY